MKAKASYTYTVEKHMDRKWIVIQDQNLGRISVTNDIENVISDICETEQIDIKTHLVIYQDSMGEWTGYDIGTDSFTFAADSMKDWRDAATEILNQYN